MKEIESLSSGTSSNFALVLDETSEILLQEATKLILSTQQNFGEGSPTSSPDVSSGAWKEIEDIIPF
jgi:hypothetical protein